MPIPQTRAELVDYLSNSFGKLDAELRQAGPSVAELPCVDDWTVKDLLAVRAWWSEAVVRWIRVGCRGERPITPAPGYRWRETPRLNADLVEAAGEQSYRTVRTRLTAAYRRVLSTIDSLDDEQLLGIGVYPWAGKYPLSRWLSINTARQYTTARGFIRRALRQAGRNGG